ncbi:MAG: ABC transporter ATP-binding protein [Butyrivibrio sp.]|jgi:putative ABC transport system ATP-binding protein|nr:ABC transporter ATP-binding protein [Butyrivibrio sp.]
MRDILVANHLRKEYRMEDVVVNALNDASFTIQEGEFVVILGPSGSGKSTTLNMIGGIDKLTSGELLYYDREDHEIKINEMSDKKLVDYRRRHIGFVFQFYNLIPNLSVRENVKLAWEMGVNPLNPDELIDKVGLHERINYYPSRLSGGQQQRVAIARALCKNPNILLCDEPTGALDIHTGIEIINLLLDFNQTYHKTVIIVTHNENIAKVADSVLYFKDGKVSKIEKHDKPLRTDEVEW